MVTKKQDCENAVLSDGLDNMALSLRLLESPFIAPILCRWKSDGMFIIFLDNKKKDR
ncbi:MAG: hypothetical protein J7K02_11150 [Deltaproteobacteria bacterium]|nr:hypothetical protein [Deltaproteobacteria bacterium]